MRHKLQPGSKVDITPNNNQVNWIFAKKPVLVFYLICVWFGYFWVWNFKFHFLPPDSQGTLFQHSHSRMFQIYMQCKFQELGFWRPYQADLKVNSRKHQGQLSLQSSQAVWPKELWNLPYTQQTDEQYFEHSHAHLNTRTTSLLLSDVVESTLKWQESKWGTHQ